MADQAINALSTKTAPETSDQLLLVGTGEPQLIDYDKLADAILNKITSKNYALDAGQMTLLAALNKLNSEKIKQIPVNITINKNVLSAKLSIDDNEFGIVCLTFAVSSAVYASVLINFGSKYSTNVISANGSNSSNFKFDANAKTLTCNVSTSNNDVHDANAILIK